MAEIKDKLVTAESLKSAYDALNNKSYEKLDVAYNKTNNTLVLQNSPELSKKVYVDGTLTKSGNAADAKATGDAIAELKNENTELKGDLTDLRTAKMERYTIKAVMDSVATPNTQYYLGNQTAVDIVLPDTANIGQIITVCWYNGETAATLSITGAMLDFDYTPGANSRSEINALWDGTYWAVLGNEMAVPSEVTA